MVRGGFAGPLRANHLDIDSRDALIQAINEFPGAVLVISDDPHLIELTADRLWLVAGGRVVEDSEAPATWILSDPAGNKVCVAAWPDGSHRPAPDEDGV